MKKHYTFLFFFVGISLFAQVGTLCTNPIVINSLPYTTTDNTANFADNYDPQTTTHPTCSTTTFGNYYHGGNDVIYAYTPTSNQTVKIEIPSALAWTGMFVYTDCANIGVQYAACATGSSAGARTINNFALTGGQTYYIYISSWPSPQTVTYTLNVSEVPLGLEAVDFNTVLNVYPNPAENELNFYTDAPLSHALVYNVNGQAVLQASLQNKKMEIASLPSGFYLVEVHHADGTRKIQRFVKK
ncbi:MAG: hypothetical protein RL607_1471 [Bacteroidota bacterium]|jgi:hypothetical protein